MPVILDLELHSPDARSTAGGGWIVPKRYTTEGTGNIHLTPHCASLGEIEAQIDRMEADLVELREEARRKFAKFGTMRPKPFFGSN